MNSTAKKKRSRAATQSGISAVLLATLLTLHCPAFAAPESTDMFLSANPAGSALSEVVVNGQFLKSCKPGQVFRLSLNHSVTHDVVCDGLATTQNGYSWSGHIKLHSQYRISFTQGVEGLRGEISMPEGRYTLGYANKKNWLSKVVVASYEDNSSIKQDSLWESREYFWGPRHDKANS